MVSPLEYLQTVRGDPKESLVPLRVVQDILGCTRSAVLQKIENGTLKDTVIVVEEQNYRGVVLSSLLKFLDTPAKGLSDEDLREEIKVVLIDVAKNNPVYTTIDYGDLMNKVGMTWRNPSHRARIGVALGWLSEDSFREKKWMISAMAVLKASGRPNNAFFAFARSLEGAVRRGESNEEFWLRQMRAIHARYAN